MDWWPVQGCHPETGGIGSSIPVTPAGIKQENRWMAYETIPR